MNWQAEPLAFANIISHYSYVSWKEAVHQAVISVIGALK